MNKASRLSAIVALLVLLASHFVSVSVARQALTDASPLIQQLRQTNPTVRISYHVGTGKVRLIGASRTQPVARPSTLKAAATPEAAARAFLGEYAPLFGVANQSRDLVMQRVESTNDGRTSVRFTQKVAGVPVFAGELLVQLDANQNMLAMNGETIGLDAFNVQPTTAANAAQKAALAMVERRYDVQASELRTSTATLAIYNPTLLNARSMYSNQLVWRVEVTGSAGATPVRELVLVNAKTGAISLNFNQIAYAKNRIVCDSKEIPDPDGNENTDCDNVSERDRIEGQPATNQPDTDLAYDYSGDTYDYYKNNFNRDSIDNAGMTLISVVRYCPDDFNCPYANAFWNGSQMTYGTDFAKADDVVAHELTHGVTEKTSGLYYYYQSGAINEALSDIFGEFVDLTNGKGDDTNDVRWLLGEDLESPIRYMADPTALGSPDRMLSPLYWLDPGQLDQGGVHFNSGVANKAAYLLTDGDTFNGYTITGLGINKTQHLFYEVQTTFLTSGSDYQDLGDGLRQACVNLTGQYEITAADCVQVDRTVKATEMDLIPTNAPAPDVEVCRPGQTVNNVLYDSFEAGTNNWQINTISGSANTWETFSDYATTGKKSVYVAGTNGVENSAFAMKTAVTVPANAYLRFNHAYDLENGSSVGFDGGVLEYSINNGSSWQDAGNLMTFNGYNRQISSAYDNPLGGRYAWSGISNGYVSTRLNLDALQGQDVRFRFRLGSDNGTAKNGWFIDDVQLYTCGGIGPRSAPLALRTNDINTQQGQTSPAVAIAQVGDAEQLASTLAVTVTGAPAGLTITLSNTNGLISAQANCACSVPVGTYPITLTVRNSDNLTDTTTFDVVVEAAGQLLVNTSLENLGAGWDGYSSSYDDYSPPFCSTASCLFEPYTGTDWLRMGGLGNGGADDSYAEQTIIASSQGAGTLSFYISFDRHDDQGVNSYLQFKLNGTEVFGITDADTTYPDTYTFVTIPVTLQDGENVLRIESHNPDSAAPIRISIDDVTLIEKNNVCRAPLDKYVYLPFINR